MRRGPKGWRERELQLIWMIDSFSSIFFPAVFCFLISSLLVFFHLLSGYGLNHSQTVSLLATPPRHESIRTYHSLDFTRATNRTAIGGRRTAVREVVREAEAKDRKRLEEEGRGKRKKGGRGQWAPDGRRSPDGCLRLASIPVSSVLLRRASFPRTAMEQWNNGYSPSWSPDTSPPPLASHPILLHLPKEHHPGIPCIS